MSIRNLPETLSYVEILHRILPAYKRGPDVDFDTVRPLLQGDCSYNTNTVRFVLAKGEAFVRNEIARTARVATNTIDTDAFD